MSWDLNRVLLIGRLAKDVELKYTPTGTAVAKFSLAVGGKPKPDGSDTVSFFYVTVWGKLAENCAAFIAKGKQIAVDGRLEQKRWSTQDGQNRYSVEVVAERVEFLAGNQKPGEHAGAEPDPGMPDGEPSSGDDPNF